MVNAAKSHQSCPTLCNLLDGSPPSSPVPGILQARILEWVAISFSNALMHACMHAKSLQSCLTLCDPMDHSPPGSSVHGNLQARILEWVAMPFSRGSSRPRDWTHISWGSCIAGGFFTAEPLGKPTLYCITVLFFCFLIDTASPIIFSDYHSKKFELPKCLFSFIKLYLFILTGG